jgi:L-aminopeptidase/D-esterase-like protein
MHEIRHRNSQPSVERQIAIVIECLGDVVDLLTGKLSRGASKDVGALHIGAPGYFADTLRVMKTLIGRTALGFGSHGNTVIGVVATNAKLDKEAINKVAQMAHDGLARTIRPAHHAGW